MFAVKYVCHMQGRYLFAEMDDGSGNDWQFGRYFVKHGLLPGGRRTELLFMIYR